MLAKNRKFLLKSKMLVKYWNLSKNCKFLSKIENVGQKLKFWLEIEIWDKTSKKIERKLKF